MDLSSLPPRAASVFLGASETECSGSFSAGGLADPTTGQWGRWVVGEESLPDSYTELASCPDGRQWPMGGDLAPCLSPLHFLGLSLGMAALCPLPPRPWPFLPCHWLLAAFAGLYWGLLSSSGQTSPFPSPWVLPVPSRTPALMSSGWLKPIKWEGSQYGLQQMPFPSRESMLLLMEPDFAPDVPSAQHPCIELNSGEPELSNCQQLLWRLFCLSLFELVYW